MERPIYRIVQVDLSSETFENDIRIEQLEEEVNDLIMDGYSLDGQLVLIGTILCQAVSLKN